MAKNFNTKTDGHDEWLTPKYITDALGHFDLDPCSPIVRPWDIADYHLNVNDKGLEAPWFGRVWCNPPYGNETFKWMSKVATHNDGIALIFARTETKGFHDEILDKADALFFFRGRLKFCYVNGTEAGYANAPSVLVAYGKNNVDILENCGLSGRLIKC